MESALKNEPLTGIILENKSLGITKNSGFLHDFSVKKWVKQLLGWTKTDAGDQNPRSTLLTEMNPSLGPEGEVHS